MYFHSKNELRMKNKHENKNMFRKWKLEFAKYRSDEAYRFNFNYIFNATFQFEQTIDGENSRSRQTIRRAGNPYSSTRWRRRAKIRSGKSALSIFNLAFPVLFTLKGSARALCYLKTSTCKFSLLGAVFISLVPSNWIKNHRNEKVSSRQSTVQWELSRSFPTFPQVISPSKPFQQLN